MVRARGGWGVEQAVPPATRRRRPGTCRCAVGYPLDQPQLGRGQPRVALGWPSTSRLPRHTSPSVSVRYRLNRKLDRRSGRSARPPRPGRTVRPGSWDHRPARSGSRPPTQRGRARNGTAAGADHEGPGQVQRRRRREARCRARAGSSGRTRPAAPARAPTRCGSCRRWPADRGRPRALITRTSWRRAGSAGVGRIGAQQDPSAGCADGRWHVVEWHAGRSDGRARRSSHISVVPAGRQTSPLSHWYGMRLASLRAGSIVVRRGRRESSRRDRDRSSSRRARRRASPRDRCAAASVPAALAVTSIHVVRAEPVVDAVVDEAGVAAQRAALRRGLEIGLAGRPGPGSRPVRRRAPP